MKQYKTHVTTPLFLAAMRRHTKPYSITIYGKEIIVYPGVFSPFYDWSSTFHIETLPDLHDKDFLEIGSGCGIISVFAHYKGARSITAVDINEIAVNNTNDNLVRHKVKHFIVAHSDVFSNVRGSYDVILFNAPYHGNKPTDILEMAVSDENYQAFRRFFRDVKAYLRPGGLIILGFSESGDIALLRELIESHSFEVVDIRSDTRKGYNCQVYFLQPL